jgi:hypothetical protein
MTLTDCDNVALYGSGGMRAYAIPTMVDIAGTSNNILVAMALIQSTQVDSVTGRYTLRDQDLNVAWPEGVSLYKRGTLNDTNAYTG